VRHIEPHRACRRFPKRAPKQALEFGSSGMELEGGHWSLKFGLFPTEEPGAKSLDWIERLC
jgi:hypothetical protein